MKPFRTVGRFSGNGDTVPVQKAKRAAKTAVSLQHKLPFLVDLLLVENEYYYYR